MCRKEERERKKKSGFAAYIPPRGYCGEWPNGVHMREGLGEPHNSGKVAAEVRCAEHALEQVNAMGGFYSPQTAVWVSVGRVGPNGFSLAVWRSWPHGSDCTC